MNEELVTKDKSEVIEISEEEQVMFEKSIKLCSTPEGRLKTIKHVFEQYIQENHTKLTIYAVLNLVAHPCIGTIEIKDSDVLEMVDTLKAEIKESDPEWWKMASMEEDD